ncbi:hypothetical protein J1C56_22690 [Aminobacter anthyllidis]|uniref:Uncharacterized protein n=1 Tax=Aminobacter anthyllidis TaxID=1035067 RepID=A0A9X1AEW9_9HYPH|nr:hypothetical protein [Aminobacter anthyllidis]MBT1158413.1 hypothetical protein [Aminobacter anthyllidis]
MSYRTLNPEKIAATAQSLEARIGDRFPNSGLASVASELVVMSRDLAAAAERLARPIWWLRVLTWSVIILGAGMFIFVGSILSFDRISTGAFDFVQGVEATLNTLILGGVGFLALNSVEQRLKRKQIFKELHGLRSLIHVIDMHQLTKDPAALSTSFTPTAHSPQRTNNPAELARYLDYCSEMLSVTGKLAALFAQAIQDEVVTSAVNDIEDLGSNLSRKIWQKITLIEATRQT